MCLSLVVPVHDRESTITEEIWALARAAAECHPDWELVVVDRGSRDRTPEILERLRHHEPRLNLVYQSRQKGFGEALRSGFLHARGEVLVALDRPGEWVWDGLPALVAGLERAHLVAGYRRKGPRRSDHGLTRWLFPFLLRLPAECLEAGVLVFQREWLQMVNFESNGREAIWELPARVVRRGGAVGAVPLPFFPRVPGRDTPLGPSWQTCLQLASDLRRPAPQPLFTPVHEASTARLRVEFLAGQDHGPEGRLSLE